MRSQHRHQLTHLRLQSLLHSGNLLIKVRHDSPFHGSHFHEQPILHIGQTADHGLVIIDGFILCPGGEFLGCHCWHDGGSCLGDAAAIRKRADGKARAAKGRCLRIGSRGSQRMHGRQHGHHRGQCWRSAAWRWWVTVRQCLLDLQWPTNIVEPSRANDRLNLWPLPGFAWASWAVEPSQELPNPCQPTWQRLCQHLCSSCLWQSPGEREQWNHSVLHECYASKGWTESSQR